MNYYKMEYEKQHPKKRNAHQTLLKIASVVIAITIVAIVARLESRSDVAPTIIYQDADIIGKTAMVGIAPGVNIYVPGTNCDESSTQNITEQQNSSDKNVQANAENGIKNIENDIYSAKNEAKSVNEHEYSSISISDSEMEELKAIVAAEAQTQSMEGRKAVVEVIFNRVLSLEYPNTVHGVLSQRGQFSTWSMRNASWVTPDAAVAPIEQVLSEGRTVLPSTNYLYFSRGKSKYGTDWIKIQDHWFGKSK